MHDEHSTRTWHEPHRSVRTRRAAQVAAATAHTRRTQHYTGYSVWRTTNSMRYSRTIYKMPYGSLNLVTRYLRAPVPRCNMSRADSVQGLQERYDLWIRRTEATGEELLVPRIRPRCLRLSRASCQADLHAGSTTPHGARLRQRELAQIRVRERCRRWSAHRRRCAITRGTAHGRRFCFRYC